MLAILLAATLAGIQPFACTGLQVHDGDSIRCGSERIRIENIDAPELPDSPKCHPRRSYAWCDYQAGYAARDALASFLSRGTVMVQRTGTDRYGRTLARVSVNGQDAGAWLVSKNFARWWR